jgi:hypothetical protein
MVIRSSGFHSTFIIQALKRATGAEVSKKPRDEEADRRETSGNPFQI